MYCSARRHGPFKSRAACGLLVEKNNWMQMKGKIPGYYPGNSANVYSKGMSHSHKCSSCLGSLLPLASERSVMLLPVVGWTTILICPGLSCFLGCGTFNTNTGSANGDARSPHPLLPLPHQEAPTHIPTLFVLHTRTLPRRNTHGDAEGWKEEWLAHVSQDWSVLYRRRGRLGSQETASVTNWLC